MKPIPTDPMQAHSRFIEAFCADIIAGDVRKAPRANAVLEITKQQRGDLAAPTVAGAPSGLSRDASQAKPLIDYRKEDDNGD